MTSERWFGESSEIDPNAEAPSGVASDEEVARVFDGHEALDRRTNGKYGQFLRTASRCTKCRADSARIPNRKQPIPLLCGAIGDRTKYRAAHSDLSDFRRADGSLRINPSDGVAPLADFLDAHGIAGLSVGHCGWADLTARLRGEQLADGVDVMILGADWYPITACSNFLLDRYHGEDHTLRTFVRELRRVLPELPDALESLFRECRIYLGNTLLCYRTGWSKKGESNLSPRSFENCREHLARHIDALAPRVVVTFGREPARSVSHLLEGRTADAAGLLGKVRRNPALQKLMPTFYGVTGTPSGIACTRNGRDVTYVPLCHPSMPNRYKDDYAGLARAIRP